MRQSGPLSDVRVAMRSKTTRGHRHIQLAAGNELKDVSESLHKKQKGWIEELKWSTRRWLKKYGEQNSGKGEMPMQQ